MANVTVLRPGSIVSLKSKIEGGVRYTRTDLAADSEGGAAVERWETTKVTEDPEEHARAVKVRGKARSLITRICSKSAFGLLCATSKEAALSEAIGEARAMIDAYNARATSTRLGLYVLQGRIAENEGEAARAIASELTDLLARMQKGVTDGDAKAVRAAANKAKSVGAMLDSNAGAVVKRAIDEARATATQIVKLGKERGDALAAFIDQVNLKAVAEARYAFLDMEAPMPVEALPVAEARGGLDLGTETAPATATATETPARGGLDLDGETGTGGPVAMLADSVKVRYDF